MEDSVDDDVDESDVVVESPLAGGGFTKKCYLIKIDLQYLVTFSLTHYFGL